MALTNTLMPYVGPIGAALAVFVYAASRAQMQSRISPARVRHRR
ncbi:hypothetical protein NBRC103581_01953 [Gluconobacter wancherniae NBRC 103581]|nr:hypothetical protein NBRC103581_01953 [Gluconobacter wancherniae NBRC 103581]